MKKENQKQKNASDLRKEAEKRLKPEIIPIEKLSDGEVRKLAHELQVHQVELGMQNEELRKTQLLIEESRQKYLDLFDFAPVGYLTISEKGLILDANLTGAAMLGIERSLLINKPISKFIVSEDQDKYYLNNRTVYDGKEANACELKMVKKDGTVFHVQLECSVVHDAGDNARQFRTLLTDISERRQSERRLSAQHAVTRVLAESITLEEASPKILQTICEALEWDLGEIWKYDQQQCILRNTEIWHVPSLKFSEFKYATNQTSFSPQIGLPGRIWGSAEPLWIADVVHDPDFLRAPVADKVGLHGAFGFPFIVGSEVLGTICFFSREIRKPDKGLLDMMAAIGRQIGLFIKHKQAEEQMTSLSKFPSENPNLVLRVRKDGIIIYANDSSLPLLNDWIVRVGEGIPDNLQPAFKSIYESQIAKEIEIKSGFRVFSLLIAPVTGTDYSNVYGRNITECNKAEEQIRKLSHAIEQSSSTIVITDTKGNIEYANLKFIQLTGYSLEEATGKNPRLLKSGKTSPEVYKELWKTIKSGNEWRGEFCNIKKNGELYWESASISPVKDDKGNITNFIAVKDDITEQKKMESELWEYKENLEAIFKSIRDGIILLDSELEIVEFNESARRICGLPDINKARGKKFELLHINCEGECLGAIMETKNTKLPAERNRFECLSIKKSSCLVSVTTYPLFDNKKQFNGCVIVVRDETRLAALEGNLRERHQFHDIIGKNENLQKIFTLIDALSDTPTTVLITGENGTGKRLVAEALHYRSKGAENTPFVVVSCSSLSDSILESELFGHVKGSFTGAISDRVGRFQKAEGGTIFLDEIGDISNIMQLRLLRVLEERVFERVGDSNSIKANVRVIAATNQDLRRKVSEGKFREDLYHRLKVVELKIPPLRERYEDIPLLLEHFIQKLNKRLNKNIKSISANVQKIFMHHKWPGNIR
ncbi:MAG: sigma 54-interacting transcriptional regulator, partial [Candidatus Scalindua sp.]